MKEFKYIGLWISVVILLLSCAEERDTLDQTGFLYLTVAEDATLLTKSFSPVIDESLQVTI